MKAFKKTLALLLVVCTLASVLVLTSCKKDKDTDDNTEDTGNNANDDKYTITVVDGANVPVEGVGVMVNTGELITYYTDANGKISFETTSANIEAMIVSVPAEYEQPTYSKTNFASGSKELTLTITKKVANISCIVTVKDQHGNIVEGVNLQLCCGACNPGTTNENGQATFNLTPGSEYQVEILRVPEGYSAPTGYLPETIVGGTAEAVIFIEKN